jgi:DNA-binding beta-propeller fold protein YncE
VTSLFSDSVTSFRRGSDGRLTQLAGTSACVKDARSAGCSLGHGMSAPEGLAVAPDGARVFAAAFDTGAVDTFGRDADSGALVQKPVGAGCVARRRTGGCLRGRELRGASSVAVSRDGKHVYATAFGSNALGVFKLAKVRRQGCGSPSNAAASSKRPGACARQPRASS